MSSPAIIQNGASRLPLTAVTCAVMLILLPGVGIGGVMALPAMLCLAGLLCLRPSLAREAVENKSLALGLFAAFMAWTALTGLWSPQPERMQWLKLLILVGLGAAAVWGANRDPASRHLTAAAGVAAFLILALLVVIEAAGNMPFNRAAQPDMPVRELLRNGNRAVTLTVVMTWGAAGAVLAWGGHRRWMTAALVFGAGGAAAFQFDQTANVMAFVLGVGAFVAAYFAPRLALLASTGGWAVWMVIAPFVTPLVFANPRVAEALPLSWAARGGIWNYVCARIYEQPWIGHGLDASRVVTDRIQVRELDMRAIPLHPHSASLQIWYETGAIGALLAAAALVTGGLALSRLYAANRPAAGAACAAIVSIGLVANVSFGAWQEWLIASMFVVAMMIGAINPRTAP